MELQLHTLEQQILALPTKDREHFTMIYYKSLLRFRTKTHKELGEENYGKGYSRDEKDAIQTMTEKGFTDEEIASHLKRSVKGITQQRQKLIVKTNATLVKQLVANYSPSNPDPSFIIPQHKNM
jgi:hypothetical protein